MLKKDTQKRIFWFATLYTLSLLAMTSISTIIHYIIKVLK